MVRYLYRCAKCQQEFEVEKSMTQAAQAEACPRCGQVGQRVFTAPGITSKGAPVSFSSPEHSHSFEGCAGCDGEHCGLN